MDTEKSSEVLDAASETPQQQETGMEKVVVSKLETPEESAESEKSPGALEDTEQLPTNGHDAEQSLMNGKENDELMVTESVKLSEETLEMETEDSLPKEMSEEKFPEKSLEEGQGSEETETLPGAVAEQPKPDASPEKISDPVAALTADLENIQLEQQPVPENNPEPLPLHKPLAESVPEPEPEKLVESVPEAVPPKQILPEPVTLLQPVDAQPPSQAEKAPEHAEIEAELQTGMDAQPEEVVKEQAVEAEKPAETKTAEVEMEKPAETELVAAEKPTEAETSKEVMSGDEPAEVVNMKPAEDVKEVVPDKPVVVVALKEVEPAAEGEVDKSEQKDAEHMKEEDTVPAPGSLSFALLEQEQTKGILRTSRTLVVLKGLPGSGKSLLARSIADAYQDLCSVVCADDHGVKPEHPEASADGYKALDDAVVACCSAGTAASVLVVVDDTNHTQERLARLGEIAEQYHLVTMFLEPRTEWSRDLSQLAKRTGRGLEEAQIQTMKSPLEEMSLPFFFGWFLLHSIQDKVRCTSMDFLKTLDTLEAFKKHLADFTGEAEKEVDLEQYFQAKGPLHCTTKFCDYGKAEGAKEYAEKPAVQQLYGSAFELSLSALFVTPRTVGARVSLTEEQLELWPADAEKEAESVVPAAASLPLGSRAHVTLGCAEGVEPVKTGLDLLEILVLQKEGQQGELVEEMELGSLAYYGKGRWLLSLREPICAQACFSSFYGPKMPDQTKKEPEKKKKQKCTIL